MVDGTSPERAVRQSLVGQDPSDPYITDLLSRAVGSNQRTTRSETSASGTRQESASAGAAAQLQHSARRAVARWAGDPILTQMMGPLRLAFRATLNALAIEDPGERSEAAARMLGIGPVLPDGTEGPNPFAAWPEERLAPARLVATRVRAAVGVLVARLRADGVTHLWPVEHLPASVDCPDGLGFGFAHVALLSLLWLDIPVKGRSGAEIAEALPMLGTVRWERDRNTLLVGAASQPDILAGDTLRRAFERQRGDAATTPGEAGPGGIAPFSDALRAYLEASPASAADVYPQTRPARRRRKPRPGRPPGTRYLIRSVVLRASQDLSADAATDSLRTRDGRIRRYVTMQDLADKVDAPISTLKDFLRANNLNWQERSGWPRE